MFLFAMLVASRTNRRGLVIGSALFATLSHLLPTLFDAGIWQGSTIAAARRREPTACGRLCTG